MEPTKVLFVLDTLAPGGAEQVAVDLANSLDRDTHQVFVCSTRYDGSMRARFHGDVPVTVLHRNRTWDVAGLARFVRLVRGRRIDVIHTHGRGSMKLVALARALRLISAPHIFHDHFGALHVERQASIAFRMAVRIGVDRYLGVDHRLCEWAIDVLHVPPDRVQLVRSGIDLRRFEDVEPVDLRTKFDLADREVVFVMVAHFRHQKDQPTVFRAIAALPERVQRRLAVVIVGRIPTDTDYYERCMVLAHHLGVDRHVRVTGIREDTLRLLAGADVGLLASKNETGPLVVLEYLASGLPIVATDTGEITGGLRGADVGFLTAPQSPHELAHALERVLELGPDGRRRMGERGRRLATEQFDQQSVTRRVELVYQEVLTADTDSERLMGNTLTAGE